MPLKRMASLTDSDSEISSGSLHLPIRGRRSRLLPACARKRGKRQALTVKIRPTSSGMNDIVKTEVPAEYHPDTTTMAQTPATPCDNSTSEHAVSPLPGLTCSPRSSRTTMSTSGSSGASRSPTPFEDASSQVMRQSSQSEDGGGSDDEPQLPGTLATLARCGGKAGLAKLRRALIQKDRKLRSHEAVAQRLKAEREYISSVISDLEEIEQAAGRVLQAMSTIEGLEE